MLSFASEKRNETFVYLLVTAHRELYGKTFNFLGRLASFYAENGIDSATFEDNISILQLKLMSIIDAKAKSGEWYKGWNSFVGTLYIYPKGFAKEIVEQQANEENSIMQEMIYDKVRNDFYEKLLKEVAQNELKECLSEVTDNLNPHEWFNINNYYGINGYYPHSIQSLANMQDITRQRVSKIILTATEKLSKDKSGKLREFYLTEQ